MGRPTETLKWPRVSKVIPLYVSKLLCARGAGSPPWPSPRRDGPSGAPAPQDCSLKARDPQSKLPTGLAGHWSEKAAGSSGVCSAGPA